MGRKTCRLTETGRQGEYVPHLTCSAVNTTKQQNSVIFDTSVHLFYFFLAITQLRNEINHKLQLCMQQILYWHCLLIAQIKQSKEQTVFHTLLCLCLIANRCIFKWENDNKRRHNGWLTLRKENYFKSTNCHIYGFIWYRHIEKKERGRGKAKHVA